MAEKIREINIKLEKYEHGLENGLITKREYEELKSYVIFDMKLLVQNI